MCLQLLLRFFQLSGGIFGFCHGDPHCYTFSHRKFDYQGACEYTLVETCGEGEPLAKFKIIGTFDKPKPRFRVTVVTEVRLLYKGSVFEFKGPFGSHFDGVPVELPFTKNGVTMRFIPKKKWVGFRLRHIVTISLQKAGRVC